MTFIIQLFGIYLIYVLFTAVLVGAFLHFRGERDKFINFLLQFGAALLFAYVAIMLIQAIFPTDRPFVVLGTTPIIPHNPTPSFPSGHATYSTVCAGFLWQLKEKWGIWALVAVILICSARVLGLVHYPLDVIVGACIGILLSLLVPYLFQKSKSK